MSDRQLHLVRHGEVFNPEGVLYGRLPGYRLSELGERMAAEAAATLSEAGRPIARLVASPLERAQQSAAPIAEAFGLEIETDPRLIEPTNVFEGLPTHGPRSEFTKLRRWRHYVNPFRPSWGEPYRSIAARMRAAMDAAWQSPGEGDVVLVLHQAPIWIAHLDVANKPLFHNPATRRCELSSITSFTKPDGEFFEVGYRTPAADLMGRATDVGAV